MAKPMLAGLKYRTCPGSNLNLCLKPTVIPLTPDPFVCYQFPLSPPGCVWASVCEGDCNFQGEAGELAQWRHSPGPYTQPPFPQSSVGPPVTRTIPDRPNREKKKRGHAMVRRAKNQVPSHEMCTCSTHPASFGCSVLEEKKKTLK